MGLFGDLFVKKEKSLEERLSEKGITFLSKESNADFKKGHDAHMLSGSGSSNYDSDTSLIRAIDRIGGIKYVEGVSHAKAPYDRVRVNATGYSVKKSSQ